MSLDKMVVLNRLFFAVESAERKAMKGAMMCMYWLAKQEIPHTTNFAGLIQLAKSLGATYLSDLNLGGNAHYLSERFMQEAIMSLGEVISNKIFDDIRHSPFFALMCDETTDISVSKEVIVYARYLNSDRKVCTSFVGMIEISDGTAKTILNALKRLCERENLDMANKLAAFGSDGAAVMIGSRGGVATLLKETTPWMISNHCVAHRLALAAAQAADEVPYVKKFKAILAQLYRFYENSAIRTAGLRGIQEVLNDPRLKVSKASDVHWLSHERAVDNLRKCLPSIITSLEREASERHDAQALGLATFVKKYQFVATLLTLSDVLPPLATLSRAFQKKDLVYSLVKPLVTGTKSAIQNLKVNVGQQFSTLEDVLSTNLESFHISIPANNTFKEAIYDKYLGVIDNHLSRCFPNIELLEAYSIFDGVNWPEADMLHSFGLDQLAILSDHFPPTIVDPEKLTSEWELFKNSACESLQARSQKAHENMALLVEKEDLAELLPNLFNLALIGLLIPTPTADCERGFSALKRIKTPLRNRLSNQICVISSLFQ